MNEGLFDDEEDAFEEDEVVLLGEERDGADELVGDACFLS